MKEKILNSIDVYTLTTGHNYKHLRFPPLGDYPGESDSTMEEKRSELEKFKDGPWFCLRLNCSVNQLTKLGKEPFMVSNILNIMNQYRMILTVDIYVLRYFMN